MTSQMPPRNVFVCSKYLRMDVIDVEKKLMHHRKYVIKVTLDQTQCTVKKKYDDITRFLDLHTKKYDLSDLQADMKEKINIRTKKQVEVCQKIFNRFNSILRDSRYTEQTLLCLKEQLYHFLDSEEPPSNDQDQSETNDPKLKKKLSLSGFIASSSPVPAKKKILPFTECWAKLHTSTEWQFYRVWLKDNTLILNLGVSDDYFYLKGCHIEVQSQPYYSVKLRHKFDKTPLQLRLNSIPSIENDEDPEEEFYESYILTYTFLKELSISKERIDAEACGKFIIRILWGDVMLKQGDPKQFFLRITHQKITMSTALYHLKKPISINVYLPLLSPFGKLKIEMMTKSESWLHKQLVEVCLCQCELLMQQVLTAANQLTPHVYKMPMTVTSEQEDTVDIGCLKCDFQSFGNVQSHFVSNQLHIYEGEDVEKELEDAREEIRMSGNRIKRILYNAEIFYIRVKELMYFKYPYQSYLFYWFLLLFLWINESFFRALLFTLICVSLWTNSATKEYAMEVITVLKVKERYDKLVLLLTRKNPNFIQPLVAFKKTTERERFMSNFEIKMKKGGNIFSKYKRLQQNLFIIRCTVLMVVGTVEKLKNLLNWTQPRKTLLFMAICTATYIVVGNFPMRYLMMAGVTVLMLKNKNYYSKLYSYNRLLVYEILRISAHQDGDFGDFKMYLLDPNKQFDFSKSYMGNFQKKVTENLENLTDIEVPVHLFSEHNSVILIQNFLMTLPSKIRINKNIRRELGLYDIHPSCFTDGSTGKRIMNTLYSFLYNVPSDRYLLEYKNDWKLKPSEP